MFKDNPDLVENLQKLDGLQSTAANFPSPPGWIINGSALLAPYLVSSTFLLFKLHEDIEVLHNIMFLSDAQGDFFRALVTAISGTKLTVLFVDYGNSDTVDW